MLEPGANKAALFSINKQPVSLSHASAAEPGVHEDPSQEPEQEEEVPAAADSLALQINHRHHRKQANVFHQKAVDIVHLRSQYPCLHWRNHDTVLRLTAPTDLGSGSLTEAQRAVCEQYHLVRGTRSGRTSVVMGQRSYFNESKRYVVSAEVRRREPLWEEELRRRKQEVRIFDGKSGGLRPIKALPEPVEVRKQQFAAEVAKLHEEKW